MQKKKIILWAHPRSLSTATELYFRARKDFRVIHEPFANAYWEDADPEAIRDELLSAASSGEAVFVKEIALHVPLAIALDSGFLEAFSHGFLIRGPRATFASHLRVSPEPKPQEFGYEALYRIYARVREIASTPPVILQAEAILESADEALGKFCRGLGIEHLPEATRWEPGMNADWSVGDVWQATAAKSRGFEKRPSAEPPPLPERWAADFDHHASFYRRLLSSLI